MDINKVVVIENNPQVLDFKLKTILLNEVQVVADIARERETPVAFSAIPMKKINEELAELQDAIKESKEENIQEELGDVLMSVVNLARHLNIEAEDALRQGNLKFENRFRYIESKLKEKNKSLKESSLEEMDSLWERSKQEL